MKHYLYIDNCQVIFKYNIHDWKNSITLLALFHFEEK